MTTKRRKQLSEAQARLRQRRAARVKAMEEAIIPFAIYASSVLKETRFANKPDDALHIERIGGIKISYGDLRRILDVGGKS